MLMEIQTGCGQTTERDTLETDFLPGADCGEFDYKPNMKEMGQRLLYNQICGSTDKKLKAISCSGLSAFTSSRIPNNKRCLKIFRTTITNYYESWIKNTFELFAVLLGGQRSCGYCVTVAHRVFFQRRTRPNPANWSPLKAFLSSPG